jgi:hypothetical protein
MNRIQQVRNAAQESLGSDLSEDSLEMFPRQTGEEVQNWKEYQDREKEIRTQEESERAYELDRMEEEIKAGTYNPWRITVKY